MQSKRKTDERWEMKHVIKVIVYAEISSTGHNILARKGFTEKM
jgi:hypothetical protein